MRFGDIPMARIRLTGTADSAAVPVRRDPLCVCNWSVAKTPAGAPVSATSGSPAAVSHDCIRLIANTRADAPFATEAVARGS